MTTLIKFENVTKIYPPETPVLQDVSFEIQPGELVSIVGRSGAGKTTLIRLVLGLETPTLGTVIFKDKNVNDITGPELQEMRRKIGCVYQDYKLLPTKTVYENVAYIMEVEGKHTEEITKKVPLALEMMGLQDRMENFPLELSGGEQQRLAVARALVNDPEVVMADEPTGNLDPYNSYEVMKILEKINKTGKTVVLLTHDREIVNKLGKRVITIENGKVIRDEEKGRFII